MIRCITSVCVMLICCGLTQGQERPQVTASKIPAPSVWQQQIEAAQLVLSVMEGNSKSSPKEIAAKLHTGASRLAEQVSRAPATTTKAQFQSYCNQAATYSMATFLVETASENINSFTRQQLATQMNSIISRCRKFQE